MSKFIGINGTDTTTFSHQSFSSIDLNTKKGNYGIVFPFENVKDYTPSFSSIITHHKGKRTICSHTECRLVKETKDIEYIKGKCLTYVKAKSKEHKVSAVQKMFTNDKDFVEPRSYVVTDFEPDMKKSFIKDVIQFWDNCDFNADTDMIDATNLKKQQVTTTLTPFNKYGKNIFKEVENDVEDEWNFDKSPDYLTLKFGYHVVTLKPRCQLQRFTKKTLIKYAKGLLEAVEKHTDYALGYSVDISDTKEEIFECIEDCNDILIDTFNSTTEYYYGRYY